jgi:tyrosine-protein kinase Etk/Wzc
MRSTFKDTLNELNNHFDLTIIDCPPVLAVTDPIIVGKVCGAMIAVVRHASTNIAEVNALVSTLDANDLRLSGVVLNGFDPRKAKSTYSYSYNYGYKYDYKSLDN